MNKKRARVWVETPKLIAYGFARGNMVDVAIGDNAIEITLNPAGKRKTAGKGDKPLFDICFPTEKRAAMFNNAERLAVYATAGKLLIKAA